MDRTSQRTTPRVHPAQRPDGGKGAQKVGSNTGERWLGLCYKYLNKHVWVSFAYKHVCVSCAYTHICTEFSFCMCIFIFCMYRWGRPLKKKSKLENRVETPCELYYVPNMFHGSKMDRVAINITKTDTYYVYTVYIYIPVGGSYRFGSYDGRMLPRFG